MKRFLVCLCVVLLLINLSFVNTKSVFADELDETIISQIEQIDLSEIEKLFNENIDDNFTDKLYQIINGDYSLSFSDYFKEIYSSFFSSFKQNIPFIISFLAIAIFVYLLNNFSKDNSEVNKLIIYVSSIAIITLLSAKIISVFRDAISTLNTLSKINDIVSPILLTLMITSGGSVSATVFSPTTVFLSTVVNSICIKILLPIIILLVVLSMISSFNNGINIIGFNDLLSSIFKWFIGIIAIIFTIILSIQGISAGLQDGITIKATKYALSNSIPIIGGIVKDGFDFIHASSIIIKNSIGVVSIFLLFSIVIKSLINIISFSLILKLISAILTQFGDKKTNTLCNSLARSVTYVLAVILMCSLLLIIYIFLIIVSANAFI